MSWIKDNSYFHFLSQVHSIPFLFHLNEWYSHMTIFPTQCLFSEYKFCVFLELINIQTIKDGCITQWNNYCVQYYCQRSLIFGTLKCGMTTKPKQKDIIQSQKAETFRDYVRNYAKTFKMQIYVLYTPTSRYIFGR